MDNYDKKGIPIFVGDTLKIFHFIGARRKRHYMYKYVDRIESGKLVLSHLNPSAGTYNIPIDGRKSKDIEIVQGYSGLPQGVYDFSGRPKMEKDNAS